MLKIIWNMKTYAFFPLFCSIFCSFLREVGFLQFSQVCSAEESARQEAGLTDWLLVTRRCTLHPVAHSTSICWQMSWQRTPTLGITKNAPRLTFSIPKRRKNRIPLKISSFFSASPKCKSNFPFPTGARNCYRRVVRGLTSLSIHCFWDWKFAHLICESFWPNWLDFNLHCIAQSKTHDIQCQYRHLTIPVLVNFLPQLQHVSAPGPGSSLSGCLAEWWSLVGWPYLCPKTI